jgi:hypothetical protein
VLCPQKTEELFINMAEATVLCPQKMEEKMELFINTAVRTSGSEHSQRH